jgi:hypothetical protein
MAHWMVLSVIVCLNRFAQSLANIVAWCTLCSKSSVCDIAAPRVGNMRHARTHVAEPREAARGSLVEARDRYGIWRHARVLQRQASTIRVSVFFHFVLHHHKVERHLRRDDDVVLFNRHISHAFAPCLHSFTRFVDLVFVVITQFAICVPRLRFRYTFCPKKGDLMRYSPTAMVLCCIDTFSVFWNVRTMLPKNARSLACRKRVESATRCGTHCGCEGLLEQVVHCVHCCGGT